MIIKVTFEKLQSHFIPCLRLRLSWNRFVERFRRVWPSEGIPKACQTVKITTDNKNPELFPYLFLQYKISLLCTCSNPPIITRFSIIQILPKFHQTQSPPRQTNFDRIHPLISLRSYCFSFFFSFFNLTRHQQTKSSSALVILRS